MVGFLLDVVAGDGREDNYPLRPERSNDAGRTSTPVVSNEYRRRDVAGASMKSRRSEPSAACCPERGVDRIQEACRTESSQPGNKAAESMGGEQWDNAVPIVYIGRPTVEKDHRRSGFWAAFGSRQYPVSWFGLTGAFEQASTDNRKQHFRILPFSPRL